MKVLKKFLLIILTIIFAASPVICFAAYISDGNITSCETPVSADEAELIWSHQFGTSYKNAPSTMTVVDGTVIVMSKNELYKMDAETGKILKRAEMADTPSYSYTSPAYYGGVIYCPLDNGTIQAFNFKTLKSLWVYHDKLGGQSLSPVKYSDGCIYMGFWNDEDQYANFVCLDVTDENKKDTHEEKQAKWTYKSLGGFYWAGCTFSGDCVIVGTDDGTLYANKASKILSLNKNTGKLNDSVSIVGDQRSGITMSGSTAYFVTKAGYLYSIKISNGKFDSDSLKKLALGGASTSTPVIYNKRLYVGVQGKTMNEGTLKVIDAAKLSVIYSAPANGYPQNSILVSDAYFKDTGKIYIYSTYNSSPGGITVYTDSANQTKAVKAELFTPDSDKANYCISSIVCDENGTLFYKNDSGYIFAVGKKGTGKQNFFVRVFNAIINLFKNLFR